MSQRQLFSLITSIQEKVENHCNATGIPGYLAGIYHKSEETIIAYGVTNVNTGELMREDTGFLIGSITKILTTTLVLQQVERGLIDLDEFVVTYLPEFKLRSPTSVEKIRVRHLLTHTNGIDADLLFPVAYGPGALKTFLENLAVSSGALFEPGEFISYSNGGMIVAGRLLEVVTGKTYHELLQRDIYEPAGMTNSYSSAAEAILRSTAVGHFPCGGQPGARRTNMFMLPDSWAPAGGTPISTIGDLLAFGQGHLGNGVKSWGKRLLSQGSIAQMQTIAHDMKTPNVPPIGLGWVLLPIGKTTMLTHSGASPGGVAVLVVIPEHDLVFAAFGNDIRATALHDQILLSILRHYLQVRVPDLLPESQPVSDLIPCVGTYRSNQLRIDVSIVDGLLEERVNYEPLNEEQKRIFSQFTGGTFPIPPRRYVPVSGNLFAPEDMPVQAFNGYSRQLLVSYHQLSQGRMQYRCAGGRMTRRAPSQ